MRTRPILISHKPLSLQVLPRCCAHRSVTARLLAGNDHLVAESPAILRNQDPADRLDPDESDSQHGPKRFDLGDSGLDQIHSESAAFVVGGIRGGDDECFPLLSRQTSPWKRGLANIRVFSDGRQKLWLLSLGLRRSPSSSR